MPVFLYRFHIGGPLFSGQGKVQFIILLLLAQFQERINDFPKGRGALASFSMEDKMRIDVLKIQRSYSAVLNFQQTHSVRLYVCPRLLTIHSYSHMQSCEQHSTHVCFHKKNNFIFDGQGGGVIYLPAFLRQKSRVKSALFSILPTSSAIR